MQQQIRKESFQKRQEIIRQQAQTSSRSSSISDMGSKVKNWLDSSANTGGSERNQENNGDDDQSVDPDGEDVPEDPADDYSASHISALSKHSHPLELPHPPAPRPSKPVQKLQNVPVSRVHSPLPKPNANTRADCRTSTVACGYSDAENLVRLQRCLKGHALESVRSRLLLPASVPHVINTLRTLYGRPELIIRSLISEIQYVPAPRHDQLETLISFGLLVQNLVDHLKAAGQQNHLSNPTLMQDFVEKLPGSMRLDWAIYKNKSQPANLETFGEFMSGLVIAASEVSFEIPGLESALRHEKRKPRETGVIHTHSNERTSAVATGSASNNFKSGKPCGACGRVGHTRWRTVTSLKAQVWTSDGNWSSKKGFAEPASIVMENGHVDHGTGVSASHVFSGDLTWPLFRIVPVVLSSDSNRLTTFAFIDEGSSYTLLEESVAKQLGVEGHTEPLTLQWTGNVKRVEPKSQRVQVDISGKGCGAQYKLVGTRTVSRLVLPSQSLKYGNLAKNFPHLRGLPLQDYELVQPKLLIGLDNLRLCVPLKLREGGPSDPIGAKCRLGWNKAGISHLCEVPESDDDKRARQLLVDTTRRLSSGSGYETGLLWRTNNPNFPDSYPMALRRLEGLERKLQKDPSLEKRVREQIYEYERKGYAHKANLEELTSVEFGRVWYLPLGFVTNPRKPEKLRLIWDAAAKVGDVSFNSKLLKGPDLLTYLPRVLYQFRQYPVAVCGDIMQMFHQIKIRAPDCQSQRFLFRERPSDHPQVYVMDVVTFGSTCSPASAQFVKNLNADEFATDFESVNEAIAVVNDVKLVHSKGGFTLRHFLSNETEVLQKIGETDELEQKNLDLERGGNLSRSLE
ncbi:uncharacterized protein LOC131687376 [Topomyia yanbarensis]|uniref:uncharacterized protein LOC131687376 n=1 Tax=Topomyia yanbarensis TaxID=2498891 RepID=UPI00273B84EB|nr:uncharacterized protein LOC131687376 [Topomyia yanbarensis]